MLLPKVPRFTKSEDLQQCKISMVGIEVDLGFRLRPHKERVQKPFRLALHQYYNLHPFPRTTRNNPDSAPSGAISEGCELPAYKDTRGVVWPASPSSWQCGAGVPTNQSTFFPRNLTLNRTKMVFSNHSFS